ncbi:MAG TPA: hypothetical protein VFA19_12840 [Gaiellaceae bacterium]|nr:hypothetical protein [Gaiellaceae bacterium]
MGIDAALGQVADPDTPSAAGSAAAWSGALAAAIAMKTARAAGDGGRAAQAAALLRRLAQAAVSNADAFGAARSALAVAGAGGEPRRDFSLRLVLDRAALEPLAIADACADVAVLNAGLASQAPPEQVPDVTAAAALAAGAARAAAHLVGVNLAVAPGDERLARAEAAAETAAAAVAGLL